MATKIENTAEFVCLGSDGASYRVIEYTKFESVGAVGQGATKWSLGQKSYRLADGGSVTVCDAGFEIVRTGVRLKRGS